MKGEEEGWERGRGKEKERWKRKERPGIYPLTEDPGRDFQKNYKRSNPTELIW